MFPLSPKRIEIFSPSRRKQKEEERQETEEKLEKHPSFATDAGEFVKSLVRFCKSVMLACGCSNPELDNNITLTIHDVNDNLSTKETLDKKFK